MKAIILFITLIWCKYRCFYRKKKHFWINL